MNIGIIGSGNVGGTLGTRWASIGHNVVFSSRNPQSAEMAKLTAVAGPNARAASAEDTVAASDIILLASPWPATKEIVEGLNLEGKVLIDATNPLLPKLEGLEIGTTTSGAELVASLAPGARVVKAFNTIGFNIMADPKFDGGRAATLFYCGDDADAKKQVHELAAGIGFDAQDAGPLKQSRLLEPFALLWISLAFSGYGREIGFQLMKRDK